MLRQLLVWLTAVLYAAAVNAQALRQALNDSHPLLRAAFGSFQTQEYWQADGYVELLQRHAAVNLQSEQLRGVIETSLGLPTVAAQRFAQMATQGGGTDQAWWHLALWSHRHADQTQASDYLSRIKAPLPGELEIERRLLNAQLAMQQGQPTRAADSLGDVADDVALYPYVRYNLGMALLQAGNGPSGKAVLMALANRQAQSSELLALRDRIYIALGYHAIIGKNLNEARSHFEQVRLQGPYSGSALLGMGWAWMTAGDAARALPFWQELTARNPDQAEVQQAWLVSAQAFKQLGDAQQALQSFQHVDQLYATQLTLLDAVAASLADDAMLDELIKLVVTDDWSLLAKMPLQASRPFLLSLANDAQIRAALQTMGELRAQHRELQAMAKRLAMLTPRNIAKVRKGIRVKAAPVSAAELQRLSKVQASLPLLLARSATLQIKQRQVAVAILRSKLNAQAEVLRGYQAQARFAIAEILENGLHDGTNNEQK